MTIWKRLKLQVVLPATCDQCKWNAHTYIHSWIYIYIHEYTYTFMPFIYIHHRDTIMISERTFINENLRNSWNYNSAFI